jgi:hypothetical protein
MSIDIGDLKNSLDKYRQTVKLSMQNNCNEINNITVADTNKISVPDSNNVTDAINNISLNSNEQCKNESKSNSIKITIKKSALTEENANRQVGNNGNKLSLEVKMMQKKLQQYTDKKNYKNITNDVAKIQVEKESIDILRATDIFNVVNDEKPYLTWRKLDIEVQKKLIHDFCNKLSPPINQDAMDKIIELINIKKLYVKREIEYDNINGRIEALPIIQYDDVSKKYIVIKTEIKKKYNAKKSARQFMNQ